MLSEQFLGLVAKTNTMSLKFDLNEYTPIFLPNWTNFFLISSVIKGPTLFNLAPMLKIPSFRRLVFLKYHHYHVTLSISLTFDFL